ncbi:tetratricopeptide repeat protein [Ekhidna sp.]|uniref:tetratricopeptide repeat protein n=2 Tax=Ekhidna sp. TaxID=2608089 RepID=UPI003299EF3D
MRVKYSIANLMLVTFISLPTWGQTDLRDSLYQKLSSADTDTTRIRLLLSASKSYGVNEVEKADSLATVALKKSIDVDYKLGMAGSNLLKGRFYAFKSEYDKGLDHYQRALELYRSIADREGEAKSLNGMGEVYESVGQYVRAMSHYLDGVKILEEIGDKRSVFNSYNNLGELYRIEDDFEKSMYYFQKAFSTSQSINYEMGMIRVLNNIGLVYGELGAYDSAIYTFYEVLRKATEREEKFGMAIASNNLGKDYRNLAQYDSALKYSNNAYSIQLEINDRYGQALSQTNLAETYLLLGAAKEALPYADRAYIQAKQIGNKRLISRSTKLLYRVNESLGKYQEAFTFLKEHKMYEDSLFDNRKTRDITNLELSYGLEKKEQQIAILENESRIADLRKNILIGAIAAIIAFGLLLFYQLNQRNKRNKLLLEKEKELDRVKSRFFANISHELRTPLTLILGPIEELKQKLRDKPSHLYLNMMKKNASRLLNQVNQLLDLSKLDSGQLRLQVKEADIVAFINGVTMSFESLAISRGIKLTFDSDQKSILSYFDEDSIEKVIINLLSNAFKNTQESDTISVEISILPGKKDLEIKVTDTGAGISDDHQGLIFEAYYHTENKMQKSTGIGLALVKELVESHHGKIEVNSAIGQGSSFIITLPRGKDHWRDPKVFVKETTQDKIQAVEETEALSVDLEQMSADKPNVLVIEDNSEVRLFIKESLKQELHVMEASNGKEGVAKAEVALPNLVVTDIMMSEMDGYEVVKYLKQNEKTSHIPIIMLTAKADSESKLKGLEVEADDFISKPFERKELLSRILNLVKSREKLKERFSNSVMLKPADITISSVDQLFVEKLLALVEENIANSSFGVEELGHEMGMSRSQIHRKLQAIIGQTPSKFIRNMRLNRAMDLLKNNAGTVAEIAYMTGFTSPNYFSKCFSDQFGHSPGEVPKEL